MNLRELAYDGEFLLVKGAVSAGTSDTQTFTEVDLLGYDSVIFIAAIGTVTSTGVATMTVKNSATSASYGSGTVDTLTDAAGTVISAVATTGDTGKLLVIDVHRAPRRYCQGQIARATANVVITGAIAIKYRGRQKPTSQSTSNVPTNGLGVVSNPVASLT